MAVEGSPDGRSRELTRRRASRNGARDFEGWASAEVLSACALLLCLLKSKWRLAPLVVMCEDET